MRVVVTRPARQAAEWVSKLGAAGVEALPLPLIAIAPPDDPAAVAAAWQGLAQRRLVMFVSPNAAQSFFAHKPAGAAWPEGLQAASPGPGTTALLVELGVARRQIVEPAADAAQFDSEALWLRLREQDWLGASVLVVRGATGRDWLTAQLHRAGAHVDPVAAYRRALPVLDAAQQRLLGEALEAPAEHLWLLSSSEAVDALLVLGAALPQAQVEGEPTAAESPTSAGIGPLSTFALRLASAHAIATHPRIAARARQSGFGVVRECRPTLAAVVACIQSLRP